MGKRPGGLESEARLAESPDLPSWISKQRLSLYSHRLNNMKFLIFRYKWNSWGT